MRSSTMTPRPPRSRWAMLAGNGLSTSNTRNRTKALRSTSGVGGTSSTESIMPATSSITIAPGSLPPSARSATSAAQVPSPTTATSSAVRTRRDGFRSQIASAVSTLAAVPGASGVRPTPPTVATALARRVRRARLGALADELVAVDLDDAYAGEVARREVTPAPQVHEAVDLGSLAGCAALPVEGAVLAGAVHQHVGLRADELGRALPGDGVLRLLQARGALGGDLGLHLAGELGRGRALLGRVGEDAQAVEADLVDEREQPLERRVGLAREAHERGGADRHARGPRSRPAGRSREPGAGTSGGSTACGCRRARAAARRCPRCPAGRARRQACPGIPGSPPGRHAPPGLRPRARCRPAVGCDGGRGTAGSRRTCS